MSDVDLETKLRIYMLIVNRYKDSISEKENRSISEIRQRISPYSDFIKNLRTMLVSETYKYPDHFPAALQKALDYMRTIKNFEFKLTFWLAFEEVDQLKAGELMDKALLCASLLRSLDAENVKVLVTKSDVPYVIFDWKNERHLINLATTSLLRGSDVDSLFEKDSLSYAFSDLLFEQYGEE
ncbi:hypothetical protein HYT84_01495 [Candidatus Micrarchaeota archaeon]|nr:hypothetical protein [Candidatus Micrarchaeota archaeon]